MLRTSSLLGLVLLFGALTAHAEVVIVPNPGTLQTGTYLGTVNTQQECQTLGNNQGYQYVTVQTQLVWNGFAYSYVNYCYGFFKNPNANNNNNNDLYEVRVQNATADSCKSDIEFQYNDVRCRTLSPITLGPASGEIRLECKIPQQEVNNIRFVACVAGVRAEQTFGLASTPSVTSSASESSN